MKAPKSNKKQTLFLEVVFFKAFYLQAIIQRIGQEFAVDGIPCRYNVQFPKESFLEAADLCRNIITKAPSSVGNIIQYEMLFP